MRRVIGNSVVEQKLIGIEQRPEEVAQGFPGVLIFRQSCFDVLQFLLCGLSAQAAFE